MDISRSGVGGSGRQVGGGGGVRLDGRFRADDH